MNVYTQKRMPYMRPRPGPKAWGGWGGGRWVGEGGVGWEAGGGGSPGPCSQAVRTRLQDASPLTAKTAVFWTGRSGGLAMAVSSGIVNNKCVQEPMA